MRRLIATLFAVAVLGLGGALAQEAFDDEVALGDDYYAAISLGFPFGVNFHFGLEDLISEGVDLRATAAAGFGGEFGIGADALVDLAVDTGDAPVDVYAGGGVAVTFGDLDAEVEGSEAGFNIHAFAGAEYLLVDAGFPEGGVFVEAGPALRFGAGDNFGFHAKVGFAYHF